MRSSWHCHAEWISMGRLPNPLTQHFTSIQVLNFTNNAAGITNPMSNADGQRNYFKIRYNLNAGREYR